MYGVVNDFSKDIFDYLDTILKSDRSYYFVVTGHSLGGAGANLTAAKLTKKYGSQKVRCYTFGPINSIDRDYPVEDGYDNIHNVYNLADTFSPLSYGTLLPSGMGRGLGKFGHLDAFYKDYRSSDDKSKPTVTQILDFINHRMERYIDAVQDGLVENSKFYWHVKGSTTYGEVYSIIDCPVNVEITCDDEVVGRITNGVAETLVPTIDAFVIDDAKIIIFPNDKRYSLKIKAYDEGTMSLWTHGLKGDDVIVSEVRLEPEKQFVCDAGSNVLTNDAKLYVIDSSNKPIAEVQENGTEKSIDQGNNSGGGSGGGGGGGGAPATDDIQGVVDLINAIPAPATVKDADAVKAARDAYDKLSAEQQADPKLTDVIKKLTDAEESVKSAQDQEAASDVSGMIAAIPDDFSKATSDQVSGTVEAYQRLTADQKKLITDTELQKLQTALNYPETILKTSIKSVKAKKGKRAVVKWKANPDAGGYQLYYKAKGMKAKTVNIYDREAVTKTIRKLKAGKTYSFKIRTVERVVNLAGPEKAINVYGKWSKVKKVRAKK